MTNREKVTGTFQRAPVGRKPGSMGTAEIHIFAMSSKKFVERQNTDKIHGNTTGS